MKKSFFFIKLLFFCISCSENDNLVSSAYECDEINCGEINDFTFKISGSMIPFGNFSMDTIYDNENYFGVSNLATNYYDEQFDIFEPPSSAGNWISIFFPHPEWNQELGDNFTQDIRGNTIINKENEVEWIFHVQSNIYGLFNLELEIESQLCEYCIDSLEVFIDEQSFQYQSENFLDQSFFIQGNEILLCKVVVKFK